ncbi:hypothetical protein QWZ03_17135 [Chitinimonas viridis]|uniref:Uncharacterized protein n=1 Tax=Chitinimonas viridis TaxID=664880 RepID=A0ABT8B8D2_9NEIS|nr:hypothetical protein [Chitinimonas viridis]MDN3578497.1 hypothetical protein [Chitinimonas viridis]
MNVEELASQDLNIFVYGEALDGLLLKFDKNSAYHGLTPVLVKGWGWKELCVAVRERRILLLNGEGTTSVGCGWMAPVKMWSVGRCSQSIALDVHAGTVEQLLSTEARIAFPRVARQQGEPKAAEGLLDIDEDLARRFEKFLSDESLLNSTAWVAHQANNEL